MKEEGESIKRLIDIACKRSFGVLDQEFLCQSVSILEPKLPRTVRRNESVSTVVEILKSNKIGCVVVVSDEGKVVGIFSERDCVLKLLNTGIDLEATPIDDVMTRDPVVEEPTITIAYALNLMSHGGFRHIPLVDFEGVPIGIISVKDIVDYLVRKFVDDLLNFEVTLPQKEQ